MEKKAIAARMNGKKNKSRKAYSRSKPSRSTVVMSGQNILGGPMVMGTK